MGVKTERGTIGSSMLPISLEDNPSMWHTHKLNMLLTLFEELIEINMYVLVLIK